MTEHTDYKTRDDGTIDYAHYMARGRVMRSAAFLAALRRLRASFGGRRRLRALVRAMRRLASIKPVPRRPVFHPGE